MGDQVISSSGQKKLKPDNITDLKVKHGYVWLVISVVVIFVPLLFLQLFVSIVLSCCGWMVSLLMLTRCCVVTTHTFLLFLCYPIYPFGIQISCGVSAHNPFSLIWMTRGLILCLMSWKWNQFMMLTFYLTKIEGQTFLIYKIILTK